MKYWIKIPLRGKKENVDEDWLSAYDYMIEKMEKRIGGRPDTSYPIWAWYQYDSKKKPKPDLRHNALLYKGQKGVRLEIEKEDHSVLLSDFILWHFPFCYKNYISDSKREANKFEKQIVKLGFSYYNGYNDFR